jgi:Tripartite tricarboxylate transporter family receptor
VPAVLTEPADRRYAGKFVAARALTGKLMLPTRHGIMRPVFLLPVVVKLVENLDELRSAGADLTLFVSTNGARLPHQWIENSMSRLGGRWGFQGGTLIGRFSTAVFRGSRRPLVLPGFSHVRAKQAPQVPTMVELGMADFDVDLWFGALAPLGTPKATINRCNEAFNEILAQPTVQAVLEKQRLAAIGGTPEQLAELIAKDRLRWARIVTEAGITPD